MPAFKDGKMHYCRLNDDSLPLVGRAREGGFNSNLVEDLLQKNSADNLFHSGETCLYKTVGLTQIKRKTPLG